MDIYLLNDDFQIVKMIDDFYSLIWRRKYQEPGDFELHGVHTLFEDLAAAKYVYRPDRSELGMIENYGLNHPSCFCKGRFAECLLSDKIIYPTAKYIGKTQEYIARDLVTTFMPDMLLAAANNPEIGSAVTTQITGKNLMEYLYEQLATAEASFSVICDVNEKTFTYRVWRGADRRNTAIFSQEWDNLISLTYEYADKDYRNYAVVAGEGEGSARQFVTVDNSADGRRREVFVDARDLQKDEDETAEQYAARLNRRGQEKLAEYKIVEHCTTEVDTQSSLRYRVDFDLGDLCTVKEDAHGISCVKRVIECEEVYENGAFSLAVVFGEGYLLLSKYLERKLK